MKALLIAESREGKLLDSTYELLGFAALLGADTTMFLAGSDNRLPAWGGRLYLADAGKYGEYNPDLHKDLILTAIQHEQPDYIVFSHPPMAGTWRRGWRQAAGSPRCLKL